MGLRHVLWPFRWGLISVYIWFLCGIAKFIKSSRVCFSEVVCMVSFQTESYGVINDKPVLVKARVRSSEKGTKVPFLMVKSGILPSQDQVIDLVWDFDIESVVKKFVQRALDLGLSKFKVIDGSGLVWEVELSTVDEDKIVSKYIETIQKL